jgi:hypothetical protein
MTIQRIPGVAVLVTWWKGRPPVLVILPLNETIQIRTERARGYVTSRAPRGPVDCLPLTEEQKRLLLRKGMHPYLISSGRVFAVSAAAAKHFEKDRETFIQLAAKCGLNGRDLVRIARAKLLLNGLIAHSYYERRAAHELRKFLGFRIQNKIGRPGSVTVEDRIAIRQDADELRKYGKTRDEIVQALSQKYELRRSYLKRILEDRPRQSTLPS